MVSTKPYAALDVTPPKNSAQLRGRAAKGDNHRIYERLSAKDRDTKSALHAVAMGAVDDPAKKHDSVADEEGWQVAGAHTKRSSKGSSTTSEEPELPRDSIDATATRNDATTPEAADSHEQSTDSPKKKRKRSKKGGKKVNKKTTKSALNSQDRSTDEASIQAQEPAFEAARPSDLSGEPNGTADILEPIIESSPSVAPTEIEEPVDLQIVLDLEKIEIDEADEDVQAPVSVELGKSMSHDDFSTIVPGQLIEPKECAWEMPEKKADELRISSHISGVAPTDESSDSDDDRGLNIPLPGDKTFKPTSNFIEDTSSLKKKKQRKRGKKGSKKVQKKAAAQTALHDGKKSNKAYLAAIAAAAVLVTGFWIALGMTSKR
ncbi:hypothetical protein CC86DRAFT_39815 [Ophiobolus disseminans]|uniref:Uncharacterized protein n=1 Tax=Ophiobolus disseminans TaxID=1469910 RepID=A0A6A6ZVU8_9PLEO|nr:hypothetical protein CC86DRAFT_39815 [Ophiobolus disseminans]